MHRVPMRRGVATSEFWLVLAAIALLAGTAYCWPPARQEAIAVGAAVAGWYQHSRSTLKKAAIAARDAAIHAATDAAIAAKAAAETVAEQTARAVADELRALRPYRYGSRVSRATGQTIHILEFKAGANMAFSDLLSGVLSTSMNLIPNQSPATKSLAPAAAAPLAAWLISLAEDEFRAKQTKSETTAATTTATPAPAIAATPAATSASTAAPTPATAAAPATAAPTAAGPAASAPAASASA
jgi:hypothetical protein